MIKNTRRIPYRETIHCALTTLSVVAAASTLIIDLLGLIFVRIPHSITAMPLIVLFSLVVFAISLLYSWIRYSVKIKVFRSFMDQKMYLSLRGVGKGTWRQISIESVVSCKHVPYSAPWKGFLTLLFSANAPYRYNTTAYLFPLPGYKGSGVQLEYQAELTSGAECHTLIMPTRKPSLLCNLLQPPRNHSDS